MKKLTILLCDLVIAIFTAFIPFLADIMLKNAPTCFFAERGIMCPACGGTRCVYSFFTGNFSNAIHYNPGIFIGIIYALVLIIVLNVSVFSKCLKFKKALSLMLHPMTLVSLATAFALFGIIRNFF